MPLIPLAPGTQEAVSGAFAQPGKGQSFGDILDAMLALRATGQKQVSDAFEAITRGNPALAAFLAAQPGFVEGLTATPTLRGKPQGPKLAKQIETGTAAFNALPTAAEGVKPEKLADIRKQALESLLPAERNKANVDAYTAFLTSPDDEERTAAATTLEKNAPESFRQLGLGSKAQEIRDVMTLLPELAPDAEHAMALLNNGDVRRALLEVQLEQTMLRTAQIRSDLRLNKFVEETKIVQLQNDVAKHAAQLVDAQKELDGLTSRVKAQKTVAGAEGLVGEALSGFAALVDKEDPATAASIAAAQARVDALKAALTDVRGLLALLRGESESGKPAKAEKRVPLTDLIDAAKKKPAPAPR